MSTPRFWSAALMVTGQMLFSVLTAIFLPSRSLAVLIGPLPLTSRTPHAFFGSLAPKSPWATILSGKPFETPNWKSPLTTEGTMTAPPWANCVLTLSRCCLKKPFLIPRNRGAKSAIGITPTVTVVAFCEPPPPPPPEEPLPPPPQPAAASAALATSTTSHLLDATRRTNGTTAPPDDLAPGTRAILVARPAASGSSRAAAGRSPRPKEPHEDRRV